MHQKQIVIERDVLKDRIISYDEFMEVLNFLPYASKYYVLFGLAAITGARPCEIVDFRLEDLDFTNPQDPQIKVKIRKAKIHNYINRTKTIQKIVWRPIPLWFAKALSLYIYETRRSGSMYLFPRTKSMDGPMTVATAISQLSKIRKQMYQKGHKWVKDIYKKEFSTDDYISDGIKGYYRFSLYAFRKMHAVLYLKMIGDKGDMNSIVATSKHMGHTKIETTMRYLALSIDDRENINKYGFMNTAPNIQQESEMTMLRQEVGELKQMIGELTKIK